MKREISSCVLLSTLAIAPVASGTSASVESAAAPCHNAKRRFEDTGILVESVMCVFHSGGNSRLIYPGPPSSYAFAQASSGASR